MIFVTVGTHEQQFNRLIACVDEMKETGQIEEDVLIQTGFSTYIPKSCEWKKMLSYDEMHSYIQRARIIITHGGPSSFVAPLQMGKVPIVVPRQKEFGEHVNDHQLDFCRAVEKRWGNIIVVEDINNLHHVIKDYDILSQKIRGSLQSNNVVFCEKLETIINEIV